MNRQPVFIISAPRSGSSLLSYMLSELGIFTGKCKKADKWNVNGYFENLKITDEVVKYLKKKDVYNLGKKFQPKELGYIDISFKDKVNDILLNEGIGENKYWLYKNPKTAICWKQFHANFPNAKWIVLTRNKEEHLASLLRTQFMDAYDTEEEWNSFINRYNNYFNNINNHCDSLVVNMSEIFQGDKIINQVCDFLKIPKKDVPYCINKKKWNEEK